jgi:hypothetical protein
MKHVLASANDSTTSTTSIESPDITTNFIENVAEVYNSNNIKQKNKGTRYFIAYSIHGRK